VGGPRHRYLFRGKCRTMERIDAGTISKGGKTVRAIFYRSVHGSLVGYARVPGSDRLAAVTQRRSSYGRDTVDQLFNQALTYDGDGHDAKSFIRAAQLTS